MNHYRRTLKKYKERKSRSGCPFCDDQTIENAIFENELFYIVPNLTKYDLWELHNVEDHLLIIPKSHVEELVDLEDEARISIFNKIIDYEKKGYSFYARGVGFIKRSVKHQHTHLIKVNNKKPRVAFFLSFPYFLFKK